MTYYERVVWAGLILMFFLLAGCAGSRDGETGNATRPTNTGGTTSLLPLHEGTFVAASTTCGSPPLAMLLIYNGHGFDAAHTHACRARIIEQQGQRYDLSNSCIDTGIGDGPRSALPMTLTIVDADHFLVNAERSEDQAYRRCLPESLPESLR